MAFTAVTNILMTQDRRDTGAMMGPQMQRGAMQPQAWDAQDTAAPRVGARASRKPAPKPVCGLGPPEPGGNSCCSQPCLWGFDFITDQAGKTGLRDEENTANQRWSGGRHTDPPLSILSLRFGKAS